ncbi:MAG: hypothetical protein H7Z38_06655 [Rubrivivax sp.]|nr:hypothetical protein [Pyrinomonadaceae bacterium]
MALGVLGLLLGGLVLLVSLLLPVVTDGRTSWEEALLGIIPGAIVLVLGFLMTLAGVVVILVGRKNRRAV